MATYKLHVAFQKPPENLCTTRATGGFRKTICSSLLVWNSFSSHLALEKPLGTTAREFWEICEHS
jgi:hypothetical protein